MSQGQTEANRPKSCLQDILRLDQNWKDEYSPLLPRIYMGRGGLFGLWTQALLRRT